MDFVILWSQKPAPLRGLEEGYGNKKVALFFPIVNMKISHCAFNIYD